MVSKTTVYAVIVVIIVAVGASVGTYYLTRPTPIEPLDKVIVALPWLPSGATMPFYAGLDQGFYEDHGILLTVNRGYGSADTAVKIGAGTIDFGYIAIDALIVVRGEGAKIKAVALSSEKFGGCVITREELGISEPMQIEGLTLGTTAGSSAGAIWEAFASKTGIDLNKVNVVYHDPGSEFQVVVAKQVDGLVTSSMGGVVIESLGQPIDYMMFWDYGFQLYGYVLVTTEEMIEENPDLVRRMVLATHESFKYGAEHVDEGTDSMLRYNPELQKDPELGRYEHMIEVQGLLPGLTDFDPEIVQSSIDIVDEFMGPLKESLVAEEIYTNEFAQGLG